MLASKQRFPRQRDLCDAFFQVEMEDISAADFGAYDTIMAMGENTIRKEIHKLEDLIEKHQLKVQPPEKESRIQNLAEFRVDSIEVIGNQTYGTSEILGSLDLDPESYINRKQLISRIRRLSGSNFYDKITYTLYQKDGQNHLQINVKEKPPGDLKFSIIFDNYHKAGILLALSARNPIWRNSRFRLVGKISDNYEFGLQFSQYLNPVNSLMLRGEATFHRENLRVFWNGFDFGQKPQFILPVQLQLGWRVAKNTLLSLGGRFENRRFAIQTNEEENALIRVKALRMNNLSGHLGLEINTLDNIQMPRNGWQVDARFQYISNSSRSFVELDTSSLGNSLDDLFFARPYPRLHLYFNYFRTLNRAKNLQVALNGMALINWAEANSIVDYFYLGGSESLTEYSVPMAGYQVNAVPVYAAFGLGFDLRYFILEDLSAHLRNSWTFASFPDVLISSPGIPGPISFLSGLSAGGTYDSFIGPVSIDFNFPLLNDIPFDTGFSIYLHFGYRF
jgi:NTE family protein